MSFSYFGMGKNDFKMKLGMLYRGFNRYCLFHLGIPRPISAMYRITTRCNLNCKHCDIQEHKFSEMDIGNVINTINAIDKSGIAYLTISGGEPLLVKNFDLISIHIGSKSFFTTLNTNGSLINKSNAKTIAENFDSIKISIDGLEQTHDKQRNCVGAYEKTLRGLHYLKRVKNRKATIAIHFSASEDNFKELEAVTSKFFHLADSFSVMPILKFDGSVSIFNNKEFVSCWRLLHKQRKLNQPIFKEPTQSRLCDASRLYYQILPDGSISPCANVFNFIFGKADDNILSTIKECYSQHKNKIDKCQGCYNRCTTEISSKIRTNPLSIFRSMKNFLPRKKR
jgi:MoaA/NifB/PqqE/SkfB family radical SAM enzyme